MPQRTLSVITYNLFHDYPRFLHLERRLELAARGIREVNPDIAVLQEVNVSPRFGHFPRRLVSLLQGLGCDRHFFVYAPANGSVERGGDFEEGLAILSRWPIVGQHVHTLAQNHKVQRSLAGYEFEERRIALHAVVEIDGRIVDIFGVHLTDSSAEENGLPIRLLQAEDLAELIRRRHRSPFPAIVAGDLNDSPHSPTVKVFHHRGFVDTLGFQSSVFTTDSADFDLENPANTRDLRVDYIFLIPGESCAGRVVRSGVFLDRAAEIGDGQFLWASDHIGIVSELEIFPPRSNR